MNEYIKRSVWITATLLGSLMLPPSAQAASFDCSKAQSRVEYLICDNAEISKLDEDLAASYKVAVQDKTQADVVRQAQKQWMKGRNSCSDTACVQSAYRKRIEQLHPSQSAAAQAQIVVTTQQVVQSGVVNANAPATAKTYPPYPDMWQWEFQVESDAISEQLFLVSNGDVLTHNLLLFGGQTTSYTPDTFFPFDINNKGVVNLSNGMQVSGVKASALGRIQLSNGLEVVSNDNVFGECYHGPIRYSLAIYNRQKHVDIANKVIFIMLDKPKRNVWDQPRSTPGSDTEVDPCTEEGPPGYITRIEAISGDWMLPLDDGTFLLSLGGGLIVRFDKNFKTRSPLLNRRFFVFDLNDSRFFIDKINGKKYDLKKTGYQPVYDDLYQYLTNIGRK